VNVCLPGAAASTATARRMKIRYLMTFERFYSPGVMR
jgi:hypothetical protein